MTRVTKILIAMATAMLITGCTVQGVDEYQRAMNKGCTPIAGGVYCNGG